MDMKEIIKELGYYERTMTNLKYERAKLNDEIEYLQRAINRMGLTDHVKTIIEVLKKEDDEEVPF